LARDDIATEMNPGPDPRLRGIIRHGVEDVGVTREERRGRPLVHWRRSHALRDSSDGSGW
jgi:hypothetical protein